MPNTKSLNFKLNIIGFNHKNTDIELRDKLSIPKNQLNHFLTEIKNNFSEISQCCIISTCNRTEVVFISKNNSHNNSDNINNLINWIATYAQCETTLILNSMYIYQGIEAIRHLMKVASGLDSMVLGEPQILGQIKESVAIAKKCNSIKSELNILFDHVFHCAKKIRSETQIGKCPVSMVFSTTQMLKKHLNKEDDNLKNIKKTHILLIGSGDTGKLLIKHLINDQNNIISITNRTDKHAEKLSADFGVSCIYWNDYKNNLDNFDVIICSAQAEHYLLTKQDFNQQHSKKTTQTPKLLIDLSMPRNIDPEISNLINIDLLNIDDIGMFIQNNALKRSKAVPLAKSIINNQIKDYLEQSKFSEYHNGIKNFRDYTKYVSGLVNKKIISEIKLGEDPEKALKEYSYLFTQKWLHQPTKKIQSWIQEGKSITPEDLFELFDLFEIY